MITSFLDGLFDGMVKEGIVEEILVAGEFPEECKFIVGNWINSDTLYYRIDKSRDYGDCDTPYTMDVNSIKFNADFWDV